MRCVAGLNQTQEALMADDVVWPQELLALPLCRPR